MDQGGLGRSFEDFSQSARDDLLDALTSVAEGEHPSIAKPLIPAAQSLDPSACAGPLV
jgi:hypothetical protein